MSDHQAAVTSMVNAAISASALDWSDFEVIQQENDYQTSDSTHAIIINHGESPARSWGGEIDGQVSVVFMAPAINNSIKQSILQWDPYLQDLQKQIRNLPEEAGYLVHYNIEADMLNAFFDDGESDDNFVASTITIGYSMS
jgi:hypothetical protein